MLNVIRLWQLLRLLCLKIRYRSRLTVGSRTYLGHGTLSIGHGAQLDIGRLNLWENNYYIAVRENAHLRIGDNVFLNRGVKIVCHKSIQIGNDSIVADSVHFYDHDHGFAETDIPIRRQPLTTQPINIGANVWIGAKSTILKGVAIGDGAIVGAGSVVTRSIPPGAIVGGVPAHVLKMRGA
jgi:acetyltransferase-like isoleucine patch superfamily enzyme